MEAWLIINSFLKTEKFSELYSLLIISAKNHGINLQAVRYNEILEAKSLPDFAILWDKDFYLAHMLENKGLRIFNNAKASEICDDKALTYIYLKKNGIPVPDTFIQPKAYSTTGINDFSFLDIPENKFGYPFVIKDIHGSFGYEVFLAKSRKEAEDIISARNPETVIIQKYISESSGQDIRINIVGGRFVSAIKRSNQNDFRSNITLGGKAETYIPTEKEISLAVSAAEAIGCDFAGVDILNSSLVCEVNSSPHFKSSDNVNKISVADKIFEYIKGKF